MCFCDGKHIASMPIIQDFKKLSKNSLLNTGGIFSYGPINISEKDHDEIISTIIAPLISGLLEQGITYKGVIYAGLMIDENNKPKVLEFNTRFGDPECQSLMVLLETDLIDIIKAIEEQKLNEIDIKWKNKKSICAVMYSNGYPESHKIGKEIFGLDDKYSDIHIFHSGTKIENDKILTNGGRVLSITSIGNSLEETQNKVRLCIDNINFDGMCYREDVLRNGNLEKNRELYEL